ncbi:uncharacterized protein LOC125516929 [Triticum urartu]|uniref:uncharacterized protein LOC125516929 n=1 Tax=Triticum urartu TaxID=4572 RepID=UPI002043C70F|nr:uncharacterized protein LOC125516929 [Triticum urartu]
MGHLYSHKHSGPVPLKKENRSSSSSGCSERGESLHFELYHHPHRHLNPERLLLCASSPRDATSPSSSGCVLCTEGAAGFTRPSATQQLTSCLRCSEAVEPHGHEDAWVRIGRFMLRVLTVLEWCCVPTWHILACLYFVHIWGSDSICIGLGGMLQWLVGATPFVSLFIVLFTFLFKEFGYRRA